jgi:hypothetical protein
MWLEQAGLAGVEARRPGKCGGWSVRFARRRNDLKPGIVQPLNDDLGRVFGVDDLCREVAAAEQVAQNVLRIELCH